MVAEPGRLLGLRGRFGFVVRPFLHADRERGIAPLPDARRSGDCGRLGETHGALGLSRRAGGRAGPLAASVGSRVRGIGSPLALDLARDARADRRTALLFHLAALAAGPRARRE